MKSLTHLCMALLDDLGSFCSVETTRDKMEIKSRVQHEGVSFLTLTLPAFAEDFERSLELGLVDSTRFAGWRKRGCLPAFLRGFTSLVFGTDGRILDEPNATAVYCIRQICRVLKKVKLKCSERRTTAAFDKYTQVEASFTDYMPPSSIRAAFSSVSRMLWLHVFGCECNPLAFVPKHGPGATAERVSGNAKYSHAVWHQRLEGVLPATEHLFTSVNHMLCSTHGVAKLTMVPPERELPVRVITVPKTLKAPRIIAIEPVCMQYTQQAVSRYILECIKKSPLTRRAMHFDDQTVNQRIAVRASEDGSYATIDLSDASDRVPLIGVIDMLEVVPQLLEAVLACRSSRAKLPSGEVLELEKFASMGSALCFPIEAMYFYTVIVYALLRKRSQAPTWRNILKVANQVHIFGDDILVPVGETEAVLSALAEFHCKVNVSKSFWRGSFRESCGADAFRGVDVTPIYVRETCPDNRRASSKLISWVATANLLHKAGCWRAADFMKREVERVMGKLPTLTESSKGLGWFSFLGVGGTDIRECKKLHTPLVWTYVVRARRITDNLSGYPALLKYFLNARQEENAFTVLFPKVHDRRHLASSARHGAVSRKRQWVAA